VFRSKALRPVAGIVVVTFTALTLQPLTAATQLPSAPARGRASSDSGEEHFSRTLNEIHEILKEVAPQAAMPHMFRSTATTAGGKPGEKVLQAVGPKLRLETERAKPLPGVDITAKVKTLRGKYKELKSLEVEVTKGFKKTEKHIRDKNLPAEILARHEDAVAEYERRKAEFTALMQAVEAAADVSAGSAAGLLQGALASLGEFMAKYPNAKTHTPTDPNNLPWGSPKPVTRAPYTSPAQFKTSRLFGEAVKVAQTGSLSGISLPNAALPLTPTPADLTATEDVQITQAIKDLAASLNNQPVAIYNWVRNNIQFVPSYGSIQGSDMALQTMRGNSFDTASLLIALLRAANVPARYVYGTIEVPADKAMNWVGGVTVPQAAISLMNQGGIPSMGIGLGGQVRSIRLEHVWAEAFVDYNPSRGAVNRNPSTWVPLDASYKQYQFTQGMDIKTTVPFDANSFITQIQRGATVNEAQGWVQNVNQIQIQQALTSYQAQVTNYVNAQKLDATVGDVLGTQSIVQENRPILLGTLPYRNIATGARFQAIPDNLRWKFRYNLYANDTDRALDNPFINYTQGTPSLAGKKITLSFSPASQADQNTINSFLPQPHADGTPIQLSELPQNLPGYLIRLIPELQVEEQVVSTGPAFTMGSDLIQNAAYFNAAISQWGSGADNQSTAGEYISTALDLQGVSPGQVTALRTRLDATKTQLDQLQQMPTDQTTLRNVSKGDLVGDLMYSAAISYFASIDANGNASARAANVVTQRMPSFGNFGTAAQTQSSFGVPTRVGFSALQIDMDRVASVDVAKDANVATLVSFRKAIGGQYSAHEHLIIEKLFTDPIHSNSPQAISAVKAIAIAANQGQRVYTLSQDNQSQHTSIIASLVIDIEVKQEITNALAAGKEVIVHQQNVSASGFSGAGYIILDPDTGAGAYKISSGANGAQAFLAAVGIVLFFTGTAGVAPFLLPLLAIVSLMFALYATLLNAILIQDAGTPCSVALADLYLGIFLPLAILAAFFPSQSIERFTLRLIAIMYGGDLFKSVASSRACK
jgi:hypothetical protein